MVMFLFVYQSYTLFPKSVIYRLPIL